ncbi:putative DNA-binding protein [Dellaglioa algida]|uniref:putative DNA-binding protein n=1 Tax=Dellaglioa algida TaxID=105612 RepID=UPI0007171EFE|nr:putative DNA-binding protein [Dellaglioa algida]MDK1718603.1 putative DNA-binding protein [Dellaglioa algida]MDK1726439.1 putative DNA-binding protein [Dellaglioa algida]MDK1727472.1 putative DNA-binding protein [Dellaglioa algida]MDK1729673.1 putative DNA-binding protein [Dellaglioa algida]MDK1732565.1 putative DNA-binding protein [Dellaglioa algida]
MAIDKTNRVNALFEFYESLLTKKQAEYMAMYYGDDFSLGEIADNFDVSRQAVYDNIKRTEKILEDYEDKLNLYHNFIKRNEKLDQIKQYTDSNYEEDQKLTDLINQLEELDEE